MLTGGCLILADEWTIFPKIVNRIMASSNHNSTAKLLTFYPYLRYRHLTNSWPAFASRMADLQFWPLNGSFAQITPKTYRQIMASDSQHSATEFFLILPVSFFLHSPSHFSPSAVTVEQLILSHSLLSFLAFGRGQLAFC